MQEESTGWATVKSVSIALAKMGAVAITEDAILLLADQRQDEPTRLGRHSYCEKEHNSHDNGTAGIGTSDRLVYWPSILRFLEEGPSTERRDYDGDVRVPSKRPISPRPGEGERQSTAASGDEALSAKHSAKTHTDLDDDNDNERPAVCRPEKTPSPPFGETPAAATEKEETDLPCSDYDLTRIQPTTASNGTSRGFFMGGRAGVVDGVGVGGGGCVDGVTTRVERGLRDVEAGLRDDVHQHRLLCSPRWVADTMDKIREVLTTSSAGAHHCERRKVGFVGTARTQDRRATDDGAKETSRRRCRQKITPLDNDDDDDDVGAYNEKKSCGPPVSDGYASPCCQSSFVDEEALASAASAAGKKGDVTALNVRRYPPHAWWQNPRLNIYCKESAPSTHYFYRYWQCFPCTGAEILHPASAIPISSRKMPS